MLDSGPTLKANELKHQRRDARVHNGQWDPHKRQSVLRSSLRPSETLSPPGPHRYGLVMTEAYKQGFNHRIVWGEIF